mgnify:CR=1 FL=1
MLETTSEVVFVGASVKTTSEVVSRSVSRQQQIQIVCAEAAQADRVG